MTDGREFHGPRRVVENWISGQKYTGDGERRMKEERNFCEIFAHALARKTNCNSTRGPSQYPLCARKRALLARYNVRW